MNPAKAKIHKWEVGEEMQEKRLSLNPSTSQGIN